MSAVAPVVLYTGAGGLRITTYDPVHADAFKRLNLAWLMRYFTVEPIDERVLSDPQGEILAPGGEILFALLDGAVVGTVALKREAQARFELTKMAVDERYQGRGYGKFLLEVACGLARQRGAECVVLSSARRLTAAISMYFKYGFVEVPITDSQYVRCDIKMERRL